MPSGVDTRKLIEKTSIAFTIIDRYLTGDKKQIQSPDLIAKRSGDVVS